MNVMEEDEGNFMCVVTNVLGSVTSSAAELTVLSKCVCTCLYVCMCVCVDTYKHAHACVVCICGSWGVKMLCIVFDH